MQPGFYLHTGNRLEKLAAALAALLRETVGDPLVSRQVVVQSRGMAHWLALRIADHNGICANTNFPFPAAFMTMVQAALRPPQKELPVYGKEVMALGLMELLAEVREEDLFGRVRTYLADDDQGLKGFQLAQRIAGCFDQYLLYRTEMIRTWNEGRHPDAEAQAATGDVRWQRELWRRLRRRLPFLDRSTQFAELLADLAEERPLPQGLAAPFLFFGITHLPPLYLRVLGALSRHWPVHLFALNPCREYWADILPQRTAEKAAAQAPEGADPEDLHLTVGNALLANWGRVGRDFFNQLWGLDDLREQPHWETPEAGNLLGRTQAAVLALFQRPSAVPREATTGLPEEDRSIQVHCCHSPMREVEVLHDQLLGMLADAPDLEPHQICVLTPDIEAYAPLIRAVFGNPEAHLPRLPFSIADRQMRIESPVLAAFAHLLEMTPGRYGASQLATLLEFEAVRQRFGLSETDVGLVIDWIHQSGMHWGRDRQDRKPTVFSDSPSLAVGDPDDADIDHLHTWRFGIERLLLGYAMQGDAHAVFDGKVPVAEIEPDQFQTIGRFAEMVETLIRITRRLEQTHSFEGWSEVLMGAANALLADNDTTTADLQALRKALSEMATHARVAGCRSRVSLSVVRAYLDGFFNQRRGGGRFMQQGITFCAMVPMRSIPFRVIALLGMDLEAFPRRDRAHSFDLMAAAPRTGDPSQREDDRYLFLEALLSARRTFYLSYVGRDVRDNTLRPPSVLIEELLEWLAAQFSLPASRLITEHRLQPYHPAYFDGRQPLFSFSQASLDASRALLESRQRPLKNAPVVVSPPPEDWRIVSPAQLARFFEHPARYFWQQRLGVFLTSEVVDPVEDQSPFHLDALAAYQLDQRILEHLSLGLGVERGIAIEAGRGSLPGGRVGEVLYRNHRARVAAFYQQLPESARTPDDRQAVDLTIGPFRIQGELVIHGAGHRVQLRYANLKPKDQLSAWTCHLVLCAVRMELDLPQAATILVAKDQVLRYEPLPEAAEHLQTLLGLYWQGCSSPLAFYPQTALTYAQHMKNNPDDPVTALQKAFNTWRGSAFVQGEAGDPYFARSLGEGLAQSEVLNPAFCRTAIQVYGPLLHHRRLMAIEAIADLLT